MSQPDKNKILKEITQLLNEIVSTLVRDPSFRFEIKETEIIRDYSLGSDDWYDAIQVVVETNNRALLLGQFLHVPVGSLRGLSSFYYSGLVNGFLRARYGTEVARSYPLILDIHESPDQVGTTWRYVGLEDAIREGIISKKSALSKKMREYDLNFILVGGATVSGPSLDMLDFIAELVPTQRVSSVVDLFSGTGSLAKVCLIRGAEFVLAVDTHAEVIERNLGSLSGSAQIVQADAFDFSPAGEFDLAIIDPFYDDALLATRLIVPRMIGRTRFILLDVGRIHESFWIRKVSAAFQELVPRMQMLKGRYSVALLGQTSR